MRGYSVTHRFELVVFKAIRRGVCPVCGKKGSRSSGTSFSQTINPFNRNAKGQVKTYSEIMDELRPKARAWEAEQFYHVKCEP
jgi:hypothetical protein